MPTRVNAFLNYLFFYLNRPLSGSIGARLRPSSISAPDPLAHHSVGLTPFPMNRIASRLGAAAVGSAPQTGSDSSQGSAITTPVPRRKRRRDISRELRCSGLVVIFMVQILESWALRVW